MIIRQIYTSCLSQGSYYIESNGESAVIDPLREVDNYISIADENNSKIKFIFETHFHADFVSGHLTLSKLTGAPIIFGPNSKTSYKSEIGNDNQEYKLGNIKIILLHTPGHTMESSCYLVIDKNNKQKALFTGDTLFIGDVGIPDVAQVNDVLNQRQLSEILYDSLHSKILPLDDDIILYPGHGAGSACGKNISKKTFDTLQSQKVNNYALDKNLSKKNFSEKLMDGLMPCPEYFPSNVYLNKNGYEDVEEIIKKSCNPLSSSEFEYLSKKNCIILDVRSKFDFSRSHIPKSLFIGLEGNFAPWVGSVIGDIKTPILLVTDKNKEKETIKRLARVGFDNILGYLSDGIESWVNNGREIDSIKNVSADEILTKPLEIIDVRTSAEYLKKHVKSSINLPLNNYKKNKLKTLSNNPFYVHCQSGYRSLIYLSILKKSGIHNGLNVKGGFKSIEKLLD